MSTLPPNLSGGGPAPTHADFAALRKFAMENALTSGAPGVRRRAFGGGSLMTPIPQRIRRSVSGGSVCPFTLSPVLNGGGTAFESPGVTPGTVSGMLPSNYTSTLTFPLTGTRYLVLDLTLANSEVQTAAFSVATTAPDAYPVTEGAPPTTLAILTHVVVDGTASRVIGCGHLTVTPQLMFETDKAGPLTPGERNVTSWWSYTVETIAA